MSGYAEARPAGRLGPLPYELDDFQWSSHRYHPPLPVKILAVVAAFWLFHPLGVALLVYFLWRAARRYGACGDYRLGGRAPWASRWGGARNAAFDDHRRATLKELDQEAEAFAEFERRQKEARDREDFESFLSERHPPKSPDEAK